MVVALATVYLIVIGIAEALVLSSGQLASVLPDYTESS
ncbi:putative membrane protein [Rhodococcus sp. MTM3W5.2]|nr:putative membrane protein [Rhodococcus sp. MTM3W5.2]